jgi:uncharacterized protein YkwD
MNIPVLNGNWVDLVIIFVLVFYLFEGIKRKFLMGFVDLLGFILSFSIALRFYTSFGKILILNFALSKGIANAVGFLLAGFLTEFIYTFFVGYFYGKLYLKVFEFLKVKGILSKTILMNKIFGFLPAICEALIFTAFILTLLIVFPIEGRIKKDIVSSKMGGVLVSKTQNVDRLLNNIFGAALNETLTFLTVNPNPSSDERVDLHFTISNVDIDEQSEQIMFFLLNNERQKIGLKRLEYSSKLRDLARVYGKDMFARGFFSHYNPENLSPFDRMENAKITFLTGGENLALAPNVHLAHQGLMNSPGHRANILSTEFKKVGIGSVDGGMYGEIFVQEFTD